MIYLALIVKNSTEGTVETKRKHHRKNKRPLDDGIKYEVGTCREAAPIR